MDYLDLVEEYRDDNPINQFEKVRVLSNRTRDLYEGRVCRVDSLEGRKPTTQAQYELKENLIQPNIYLEEDKDAYEEDYFGDKDID